MALPDSRACWLVAASAALYIFFGMMLPRSEPIMYVGFMDTLKVNRQKASWPLTVAITVSQLSGPLCGVLGMWVSDRVLLVAGALLCALPVMFCALTQSLGLIIFLYGVLYGFGLACVELLPFTIVARHFVRYRGAAIGLVFVAAATSGFVFPLVIEALRKAFEFQTVLLILGSLELIMLFGCIFVDQVSVSNKGAPLGNDSIKPESSTAAADHTFISSFEIVSVETALCADLPVIPKRPAEREQSNEALPLLDGKRKLAWRTLAGNLRSLASPVFLHLAVSRAMTIFVVASFAMTIVDYGTDIGLLGYEAVAMVTAMSVGDLVSRMATGLLLDYKLLSGEALMMWSFALQAAIMVLITQTKKYWVLLVSCFFTGLTSGGRASTSTVMVTELFSHKSLPLSLGVMNMVTGLFCLARPPLIGHARDVLGSYSMLYAVFAVITAAFTVTWAVSMCLRRCQKSQQGTDSGD